MQEIDLTMSKSQKGNKKLVKDIFHASINIPKHQAIAQ